MTTCTAPVQGHRTASGRAACPACGGRGGYRSYSGPSYYSPPPYQPRSVSGAAISGGGRGARPRWAPRTSATSYTATEIQALAPIRRTVESLASNTQLFDVFLCHAWDDRKGAAKDLSDLLTANDVKVWFSEKEVALGVPLLRAIDKGLAKSRAGIVLVTPAFLKRLDAEGIADKELSALLAREQLVPVVHGTTFDALRDVSPLLASRSGLSTAEDSMAEIAVKIGELVKVEDLVY